MRNCHVQPYIPDLDGCELISYSHGSNQMDPFAFRIVRDGDNRLDQAIKIYPKIGSILSKKPILVNCYPATLSKFPGTITIDTYLRKQNFSRALLLGHASDRPTIIIGQPFPVLDFFLSHLNQRLEIQKKILIVLGGYWCPGGLDQTILDLLINHAEAVEIFHAYGVAEVNYACLLGQRDPADSRILYQCVLQDVNPIIEKGRLVLEYTDVNGFLSNFDTEDSAEAHEGNFIIAPSRHRVPENVVAEISSWNSQLWHRYTGYLKLNNDYKSMIIQLRPGLTPNTDREMDFFEFCKLYGMSWSDKPCYCLY
ncbi:MAG: hypothetical protein G8237_13700 [Magnetococcales bacterium]|nr:hypothetical protein [Magnetococcales bacterium]